MDRDWTDKRTDDLVDRVDRFEGNVDRRFDKVDERFDKVDARFDRFEGEVKDRFDKVDERFDKVDEHAEARSMKVEANAKERSATSDAAIALLGEKMDKMNRNAIGGLVTILAGLAAKFLLG